MRNLRAGALLALEIVAAVALGTAAVAALSGATPAGGLGVVYLPVVLLIAIRRGEMAALVTAVLSVLALNFFFIPPRHRLEIARSRDVVELAVFLIAAVVAGRLAAVARHRASEAESRALTAARREREASLLAEAASRVLGGASVAGQLPALGAAIATATGASRAWITLSPVPSDPEGGTAVRLPMRERAAWLHLDGASEWSAADVQRLAEPLGRLIDVGLERERVAAAAAEAETDRRTGVARTAILHSISHDLRSPLTAVTTAAGALRAPDLTDGERKELIDAIEVEGARLARLVNDLLDLSKIQAGAAAPQTDWCDMQDVVASAVAHVPDGHPIELRVPADLPLVRADPAQLERVFSNLIENAMKFSPAGAPVTISGAAGAGRVTVRVTDRGRGIPVAQRPRVFEPFFRGRPSGGGGTGPPGSGLGLAISRGFVEANGGRILLQSDTGRGTSFAVSFPLVDQPAASGVDFDRGE